MRKNRLVLKEELDELDLKASENVDDIDIDIDDANDNLDQIELDLDSGINDKKEIESVSDNDYSIKNVSDQLDGMIKQWFELAQNLAPEKKEPFLKLGDRLSELTEILKTEFLNARE